MFNIGGAAYRISGHLVVLILLNLGCEVSILSTGLNGDETR